MNNIEIVKLLKEIKNKIPYLRNLEIVNNGKNKGLVFMWDLSKSKDIYEILHPIKSLNEVKVLKNWFIYRGKQEIEKVLCSKGELPDNYPNAKKVKRNYELRLI